MSQKEPADHSSENDYPKLWLATFAVMLACVSFGTVPYFAKSLTDAGLSSSAIAFYRYILSAIIFAPFLFKDRSNFPIAYWGFFSGIVVGVTWIGYVVAIETVPVSTAGVIYMSYPVFTLIIGWIFFKNRLGWRSMVAALSILIAATIANHVVDCYPSNRPTRQLLPWRRCWIGTDALVDGRWCCAATRFSLLVIDSRHWFADSGGASNSVHLFCTKNRRSENRHGGICRVTNNVSGWGTGFWRSINLASIGCRGNCRFSNCLDPCKSEQKCVD